MLIRKSLLLVVVCSCLAAAQKFSGSSCLYEPVLQIKNYGDILTLTVKRLKLILSLLLD
jgi:hypothetical protein